MNIKNEPSDIIDQIQNLQFNDEITRDSLLFRAKKIISGLSRIKELYIQELEGINWFEPIMRDVWSDDGGARYERLDRKAWEEGKKRFLFILDEICKDLDSMNVEKPKIHIENGRPEGPNSSLDDKISAIQQNMMGQFSGLDSAIANALLSKIKEELQKEYPNKD
jgi:hypothetical protein